MKPHEWTLTAVATAVVIFACFSQFMTCSQWYTERCWREKNRHDECMAMIGAKYTLASGKDSTPCTTNVP